MKKTHSTLTHIFIMNFLPAEIQETIYQHLKPQDLQRLRRVNHEMYDQIPEMSYQDKIVALTKSFINKITKLDLPMTHKNEIFLSINADGYQSGLIKESLTPSIRDWFRDNQISKRKIMRAVKVLDRLDYITDRDSIYNIFEKRFQIDIYQELGSYEYEESSDLVDEEKLFLEIPEESDDGPVYFEIPDEDDSEGYDDCYYH